MSVDYRQIVAGGPLVNAKAVQQMAAETTQARLIERQHWLSLPVTNEILQSLLDMRNDAEQSAKAFALSGDNAECARKIVELAVVDKITTILKNP